jgi:hypothetical protein
MILTLQGAKYPSQVGYNIPTYHTHTAKIVSKTVLKKWGNAKILKSVHKRLILKNKNFYRYMIKSDLINQSPAYIFSKVHEQICTGAKLFCVQILSKVSIALKTAAPVALVKNNPLL